MKTILCLSGGNWRAVPPRTQQWMTRLSQVEILYFEPPSVSVGPFGNRRRRPATGGKGKKIRDGITVYRLPPVWPGEAGSRLIARHNQKRLASFIQSRLQCMGCPDPILWIASPRYAGLTDYLTYSALVYDAGGDFPSCPPEWEEKLIREADAVLSPSPGMASRLSAQNKNVFLLPDGVNYTLFAKTEEEQLAFPPELFNIKNPILGFAGTLWGDTDLAPVEAAAAAHPEWSFVFVGKVRRDAPAEKLRALPNVRFLGRKKPGEVPDYVVRFDVCLDLCRERDRNSDVVPARLYEYLSTGRPIVSASAGRRPELEDAIYSASDPQEFTERCKEALLEQSGWKRNRRRELGAAASWKGRVAELLRDLKQCGIEL